MRSIPLLSELLVAVTKLQPKGKEGKKEGEKKGRAEERVVIAKNMKMAGADIQMIIQCTNLTKEQKM